MHKKISLDRVFMKSVHNRVHKSGGGRGAEGGRREGGRERGGVYQCNERPRNVTCDLRANERLHKKLRPSLKKIIPYPFKAKKKRKKEKKYTNIYNTNHASGRSAQ